MNKSTSAQLLSPDAIENILIGSTIFASGGGGTLENARKAVSSLSHQMQLVSPLDKNYNGMIADVFVLGPATDSGDPQIAIEHALEVFQDLVPYPIDALVPFEMGPECISDILTAAELANVPVMDADLMGYRSSPVLHVGAVTLNEIEPWLPMVACNSTNDTVIIQNVSDARQADQMLRALNKESPTTMYVVAGRFTSTGLADSGCSGSISCAQELGESLQVAITNNEMTDALQKAGFFIVGKGKVIEQKNDQPDGMFTRGSLQIESKAGIFEALFKNEFLVLLHDEKVMVTCPDTITLFDPKTRCGVSNGDNNLDKEVWILARNAVAPLRTHKGRSLFQPANLGLDYPQVLMEKIGAGT